MYPRLPSQTVSPRAPDPRRVLPLNQPLVLIMLVFIAGMALAVSVALFLDGAWHGAVPPRALEVMNFALSSAALAMAACAAWRLASAQRHSPTQGWITICAWTKRVWWEGQWITFEEFLTRRFNLLCTHGICDEAAEDFRLEVSRCWLSAELRRRYPSP